MQCAKFHNFDNFCRIQKDERHHSIKNPATWAGFWHLDRPLTELLNPLGCFGVVALFKNVTINHRLKASF